MVNLEASAPFGMLTPTEQAYAHALGRADWEGAKICLLQCSAESTPIFCLLQLVFSAQVRHFSCFVFMFFPHVLSHFSPFSHVFLTSLSYCFVISRLSVGAFACFSCGFSPSCMLVFWTCLSSRCQSSAPPHSPRT